jgi:hypothetical protein
VHEPTSASVTTLLVDDDAIVAAWTTELECHSALARAVGAGRLATEPYERVVTELTEAAASWAVVAPTDALRRSAIRSVRVHDLRAADAIQLASALLVAEDHPASLEIVSLDDRLVAAARREGFAVVVPAVD